MILPFFSFTSYRTTLHYTLDTFESAQSKTKSKQVVNNVTKLLNLIEERGGLLPPSEEDEDDLDSNHTVLNGVQKPLGARGNVVKEILTTERKYVQDLEVLQVSLLALLLALDLG